nr:type VI secretion system-associated protein TagF [uncultured Psychrobacter sp.]
MTPDSLPLVYFGKLPARGDFIRARVHISETTLIDQWVSEALTRSKSILNESIDDNSSLNAAQFLNFSHVDTAANQIMTGVLIPSHDSSHRQYPLIGFGLMHVDKPKLWMNYLPIKSLKIWDDTHAALSAAKSQADSTQATDDLNHCSLTIDKNASTHYYDFINKTTLQDIAASMAIDKLQLVQQIIATGLLFLPTYSKGFNSLNKTICWCLPADKAGAIFMATFWHDLISGFYQPHQLYLNTYLYRDTDHHCLLMNFSKPDSRVLSQLTSTTDERPDDWVVIAQSEWTQGYIDDDIGLTRFNKILMQDDLYLYDTRQLFKQIFLAQ